MIAHRIPLAGFAIYLAAYAREYAGVLADALVGLPRLSREPHHRVLLKQIYFTGIESLPLLCFAALLAGLATTEQLYRALGQDMTRTIDVFRLLLVQKGAVLLVAIYVLARSGSAMASELANAKQRGEVASLYRMGIDVGSYLVAPRVLGAALSVAALTVCFQVVLVFGGFAVVSLTLGWDYALAVERFGRGVQPLTALVSTGKSFVLGAIIAVIACNQGLRAPAGPQGVPVAARTTIVHGFAAIIFIEAGFTVLTGR